jgi:glycosyltransferase involved in cell wall biosynthesis
MIKKKILHIITSIDNGGAENHLYDLILKQVKIYNVFLIYFKGSNYHRNNLVHNGVKIFKVNFSNKNVLLFVMKFLQVLKIYKKIRPEIVHCHLWISELYGLFLKLLYQKSFFLVITKHLDSFIFEGSFGRNFFLKGILLEKIIFNHASHIIFISKSVKNFFLQNININRQKYSTIYYGVNFHKFSKFKRKESIHLKKKLNIDNNTFILGCVARHVEQKSLDILLKSFSLFVKRNPKIKIKLIMIGKGHLEKDLKQLAKNLSIYNKTIWIRNTNFMQIYYNIFDIFCLTSKYEGLGLVLLESLASGVPILATKSGAIPEIVKNKINGHLVRYGDIENFSRRIPDTLKLSTTTKFKKYLFNMKNLFSLNKVFLATNKVYSKARIKSYF